MIIREKICKFLMLFSIIFLVCFMGNAFTGKAYAADNYSVRDGMCSMSDSSINRMESDHFQIVWGNSDTTGTVNEEFVKGNLVNLENIREFYVSVLGMKDTSLCPWGDQSTHYKTNLYIAETGLSGVDNAWAYMSTDKDGYAYMVVMPGGMRVDEPSWVLPHEYAHAIVYHQGGVVPYEWQEPLANWYRDQFLGSKYYKYGDKVYGPASDFFSPMVLKSDYYFPHMLNYYDAWPVLLYVSENPDNINGLGMDTMKQAILDKTENENSMLDRIARISGVSVKDILGYYTRRMVTMDFSRQYCYLKYLDDLLADSSNKDKIYTTLTKSGDWLTVSDDRAPMQQGYNVIPLDVDLSAKNIVVNFESTSSDANADFRVNIVTKTADNTTRYSTMWSSGKNSIALNGDEKAAYLVVCATPNNIKQLETTNESAVGTRYTYKIQVSGSDEAVVVDDGITNNDTQSTDTDVKTDDTQNTDSNEKTEDAKDNNEELDNVPKTGDGTLIAIASIALLIAFFGIKKYINSKKYYY